MKVSIFLLILLVIIFTKNFNCENNQSNEPFITDSLETIKPPEQTVEPILINHSIENVQGVDNTDNYWIVKPEGYSDIYNYQDDGIIDILSPSIINEAFTNVVNNLTFSNNNYNLIGIATNQYYSQYYLLYEFQDISKDTPYLRNNFKYMKNKLYYYILAKMENNVPIVIHSFGPRSKIEINDIVYLSIGTFQLGPLLILKFYK